MNSLSMLDATLIEILNVVNPSTKDMETRMRIIDELRHVVSSIESLKGATVEPFGSFLSQLYSRWGDLDISIELPNGSYILVPAKKHKQMLLGEVLKPLRRTGSFRRLQFVSHARVPILKLESKFDNISCDISINNLSGHMKSNFLLWISIIDRRFRDMVLLVKEWAKAHDINNPKNGTLNSYSLSLLVIFHFQTCTPAILPPLRDLYPGNIADELTGVRVDIERRIEEIARSNIARFRNERRVNHSSLSQLFISFLGKFSEIDTRGTEQGICTFSGRWETISTNTRWLPKTYALFIEDPFEQPENSARAVSRLHLTRIGEAFRNTHNLLIDPYQNRDTIIPSLVRHEISRFFPGAAFVFPRINFGPYPWSNHDVSHNYHSSSPAQNRFHKGQNGKPPSLGQGTGVYPPLPRRQHQNAGGQKPAQQWHGQKQRQRQGQGQGQGQGQAQPVIPASPHNLLTSASAKNNRVPKSVVKASPAVQPQQIWRQKHLEM